ncbi:MAG: hypothetical protein Hyperionvirus18_30 [Hyperionvirus sp.]|uniref:Ankyrin repeat protein n=1 Tax=Hyperionvirus sp. TaxID=2487770 RepID=A0A3G5AC52_9VIRU|nr:MAG: hypothetical protein Hyperionvirus18_30 [Hyperionvirus sp.]
MEAFVLACRSGEISKAKELLGGGTIDLDYLVRFTGFFESICEMGNVAMAEYIYNVALERDINVRRHFGGGFIWSCHRGNINIAKWLIGKEEKMDIHWGSDVCFRTVSIRGHHEMLCWLLTLDRFSNELINEYAGVYTHNVVAVLYKQKYIPVNKVLRDKFDNYRKWRIRYFKFLIVVMGRFLCCYIRVCEERYKMDGVGYYEAKAEFKKKLN